MSERVTVWVWLFCILCIVTNKNAHKNFVCAKSDTFICGRMYAMVFDLIMLLMPVLRSILFLYIIFYSFDCKISINIISNNYQFHKWWYNAVHIYDIWIMLKSLIRIFFKYDSAYDSVTFISKYPKCKRNYSHLLRPPEFGFHSLLGRCSPFFWFIQKVRVVL